MRKQFVAVLENGAARSPFAPAVARYTLELPLGTDATIAVDVVDAANIPVKLAGGSVRFTVKKSTTDTTAAIGKTGTLKPTEAPNRVEFAIVPADTKNLSPGRYVWDVWLMLGGKRDCIMQLAPFVLLPAVGLP